MVDRDVEDGFDLEASLARPLVARVATSGPRVRPVWFLWEEERFWWLTGPWSALPRQLEADPRVALVVDDCDLATGEVRQVVAHGQAQVHPFDVALARRKLVRYLGGDETRWDSRFRETLDGVDEARLVRLAPQRLIARDLSYRTAG